MRLATAFILLATGALWLAWEFVLLGAKQTPISVVMKDAGMSSCGLAFGWTLLAGHFWVNWDLWDRNTPFNNWPIWVALLGALLIVDAIYLFWVKAPRPEWPLAVRIARYPGLWALLGLAAGALTWPQRAAL